MRQLEYLVAIADTLHFKRAAERCNTTQPTLSEQLKALEHRLGAQLVERSRSRVVMTPLGHQIVDVARRMLRDGEEIKMLASSGGRELAGLLRLGLPPTIGPYLLPHVLPALHKAYPSLKLYVRESPAEELPRALEEGRLDVIISLLPLANAELSTVALFREPLLLAVASDHRLAACGRIRKEDLEGEDMLALGPGHQLHEAVLSLCTEFGAKLRYDFEGTSLHTLREMVVMGLGITFLPGLYAKREIETDTSLKVLTIEGRAIYRTVGMAWRKTSARQSDYERLAEFFRAAARESFASPAPTN